MTDDTKHIILDNKYARIIKELSGMYNIGMDEAADIFYNSGNFPKSAELLLKAQNSPFEVMADFSRFIWNNYQQTHKISIGRQTQMLFEYLQKYYPRELVAEVLLEDYERKRRKDNVFYLRRC